VSSKPAGTPSWPGQPGAEESGAAAVSPEVLQALNRFQQKLSARGARGIIGLSRQFKIMDDSGNKQLEYNEWTKAIRDYRIDITEQQTADLFNYFDRDGSGAIDYDEFLRAVRGEMNEFRRGFVLNAFKVLDKTGDGIIQVEDIKGVYDASNHPDVRMGKKTEEEVLGEFLSTFETHHAIAKGGVGLD
jgi:Ca2+-binding EF-hand superfamily protein